MSKCAIINTDDVKPSKPWRVRKINLFLLAKLAGSESEIKHLYYKKSRFMIKIIY